MKPFMLILVLVACLLAACGQNTQAPIAPSREEALLTDADIDKAQLQLAGEVKELVGSEEGLAPAGQDLAPLADIKSELSTQAVLSNASGAVYYLSSIPVIGPGPGCPVVSRVIRHDQKTDKVVLLLETCRAIQSVSGGLDNIAGHQNSVVVSMRQLVTPPPGFVNDFEVYLITFSDVGTPFTFQLTSDTVDNTNVSVTADRSRIVYQQPFGGKDTIMLRTRQGFASYNLAILSSTLPQRHPAISSNGQFIALVRDPVGGSESIQRYSLATNSYLTVTGGVDITNNFEFPSVSADGQKVLFLRRGTTQLVRLKNLSTGSLQTVASGVGIRHPFLAADGRFIVYQDSRIIVTKDLLTGQVLALTSSLFNSCCPMWQQPIFGPTPVGALRVNISGLPSGQNRVSVTGLNFNSGLFSSSRTFSNLTPNTYTVSAPNFALGQLGKPTCRLYFSERTMQSVPVPAFQTMTVNVAYTSEPCPPEPTP